MLLEASSELFAARSLHARLQVIVDAVCRMGWGRMALTVSDPALEILDVASAGVDPGALDDLALAREAAEAWREQAPAAFEAYRVGRSFYYLSRRDATVRAHLRRVRAPLGGEPPLAPEGVWDACDVLYAPLGDMDGRSVGIVSLDAPASGLAPTPEDLAPVELLLREAAEALERQRHALALARVDTHYRTLFEMAGDGILVLNDHGAIADSNAAAGDLLGWSRDLLIGRSFFDLNPPEVRAACERKFAAIPPGESVQAELPFQRADGSRRCIEVTCAALPRGARQAILRDVTERRRAEEQICAALAELGERNRELELARAEAEQASRLKSEFLANTSHELRTPLAALIGYLQLVQDGLCDGPEEERRFIATAFESSKHLLAVINDVLDVAKIEAGRLHVELGPVPLDAVFGEVESSLQAPAAARRIELRCEDPGQLVVRADRDRLRQVLLNLVGNALKFTGEGGHVRVWARCGPDGHARVEVTDDGIGVPEDKLHVIFEKFAQGDGSMTRRYGGTGLGLAISRTLLELMGGCLWVYSAGETRGSTFGFALPVVRDPGAAVPVVSAGATTRVLVVEDEPAVAAFLARTLESQGFEVVLAGSAEAGLEIARRTRPQVLVIDAGLPAGEPARLRAGWDLATALRTSRELERIPVVRVAGCETVGTRRLAMGWVPRGSSRHKPVDPELFVACVRELAELRPAERPRVLLAGLDAALRDRLQAEFVRRGIEPVATEAGLGCLEQLALDPGRVTALVVEEASVRAGGIDLVEALQRHGVSSDLRLVVVSRHDRLRWLENPSLLVETLQRPETPPEPEPEARS